MTLLMGAVAALHPKASWYMNNCAFARALNLNKGNLLAPRFYVYDGVRGRSCHDFDRALSLAHTACLIEYSHPEYTHFYLASPRAARELCAKFSREERVDAVMLMEAYWEEINSREAV